MGDNESNDAPEDYLTISKQIEKDILELIGREDYPLSTRQVALKIKRSWHAVQNRCLELQLQGKISRMTVAGSHLWIKKGHFLEGMRK